MGSRVPSSPPRDPVSHSQPEFQPLSTARLPAFEGRRRDLDATLDRKLVQGSSAATCRPRDVGLIRKTPEARRATRSRPGSAGRATERPGRGAIAPRGPSAPRNHDKVRTFLVVPRRADNSPRRAVLDNDGTDRLLALRNVYSARWRRPMAKGGAPVIIQLNCRRSRR